MKPEWTEARSRYLQTRNIIWAHYIRAAEIKASVFYGVSGFCLFFVLTNFLTRLPDVLNGWLMLVGCVSFIVGRYIILTARETPPRIRQTHKGRL